MHICLWGPTALQCWRHARSLGSAYAELLLESPCCRPSAGARLSITKSEAASLAEQLSLSGMLHVAVGSAGERRKGCCCHVIPESDSGQFIQLQEGVYLPSPEFVYLCMSSQLDFVDLVHLGHELTSVFAISGDGRSLVLSPALTDLDCLAEACQHSSFGNKQLAMRALSCIKEGAASPPEIEMSMKLGLPFSYGGGGLKRSRLNSTVVLSEAAASIAGKAFVKPDFLVEGSRLVVEYNSFEWHSDESKKQEDDLRRQALAKDGYEVVFVDYGMLSDSSAMLELTKRLYKSARIRFQPRVKGYEEKRAALFERFASSEMLK